MSEVLKTQQVNFYGNKGVNKLFCLLDYIKRLPHVVASIRIEKGYSCPILSYIGLLKSEER